MRPGNESAVLEAYRCLRFLSQHPQADDCLMQPSKLDPYLTRITRVELTPRSS